MGLCCYLIKLSTSLDLEPVVLRAFTALLSGYVSGFSYNLLMNKKNKNANLYNIIFNIVLPVVILKQLTERTNPTFALLLALSFPIAYFFYEYYKTKTKNLISILGFLNILFTGGLALYQVKGIWFAVKEAAFPLIIGIGVYITISPINQPLNGFCLMRLLLI